MPLMMFTFSPRASRPVLAALALGTLLGLETIAEANDEPTFSVEVSLQSPLLVLNPSGLPMKELYHLALDPDIANVPTHLWKIKRVQTRREFVTDAGTSLTEEDAESAETTLRTRYFAHYESMSAARRVNERGIVGWQLLEDEGNNSLSGDTIVGFIRSNLRPSQMGGSQITGVFTGATGEAAWQQKQASARSVELSLTGAHFAQEETLRDRYVLLDTASDPLGFRSFQFELPGFSPAKFWQFNASNPVRVNPSTYVDLVSRFDGLTRQDLVEAGFQGDPLAPGLGEFWQRNYFIVLKDEKDTDRDGIPDFIDLTFDLVAFPWYADFDLGNDWYYSVFLQNWVYSTPLHLWHYNLGFGWTFVPRTSDDRQFWFWAHSANLGWLYTSRLHYPYVYRAHDDTWLYHVLTEADGDSLPPGFIRFWNLTTNTVETLAL